MNELLAIVRAVRAAIEAEDAPGAAKLFADSGLDAPATFAGLTRSEVEQLSAEVDAVLAFAQERQVGMARTLLAGGTARRAGALYSGQRSD
jgi:hypothetical protein